jgi:hypothetical protein
LRLTKSSNAIVAVAGRQYNVQFSLGGYRSLGVSPTTTRGIGRTSDGDLLYISEPNGAVRAISRADGTDRLFATFNSSSARVEKLLAPIKNKIYYLATVGAIRQGIYSIDEPSAPKDLFSSSKQIAYFGAAVGGCFAPDGPFSVTDTVFRAGVRDIARDDDGGIFVSAIDGCGPAGATRVWIRRISPALNTITTIAGNDGAVATGDGGVAITAGLEKAQALAWVAPHFLFVGDGPRVRVINMATGTIDRYAGGNSTGFGGDGRLANTASLIEPRNITTDSVGNLYFFDGPRIRTIDARTKIISSVTGSRRGFSGDGGSSTEAGVAVPVSYVTGNGFPNGSGMMIDNAGNLLFHDGLNQRIRIIHCIATPAQGVESDCDRREFYSGERVWVRWNIPKVDYCETAGANQWRNEYLVRETGAEFLGPFPRSGPVQFKLSCSSPNGQVEFSTTVIIKDRPTTVQGSLSVSANSMRAVANVVSSGVSSSTQFDQGENRAGESLVAAQKIEHPERAQDGATGSASQIVDSMTGSLYRLVGTAEEEKAWSQRWVVDYLGSNGNLFARRELPSTTPVVWRGNLANSTLPTSGWIRACSDRVWAIQDGYDLFVHVANKDLTGLEPGRLTMRSAATVTVVSNVECAPGGAVEVKGYAFGVSADEPPLRDEAVPATYFKLKLDPMGRESARKSEARPISVGEICALPRAPELEGFCRAAEAALQANSRNPLGAPQ